MTAEVLAIALGGRRCGRGWIARCPAHEDRRPSLSLRDSDDGRRALVFCHAGCKQSAVVEALRARGLWPERQRRDWTPGERSEYYQALDELSTARHFTSAALALAEEALAELPSTHPDRLGLTRLEHQLRSGDAALVAEYREWSATRPDWVAALARAGKAAELRSWVALAEYVVRLAEVTDAAI